MRAIAQFLVLVICSFVFGLLIRWPALSYSYFCWDEHDYIAHNIYARKSVGHFECPYSNKWPLGHALIYFLTRLSDPLRIEGYRIATMAIDATSAALIGFWLGKSKISRGILISLLYLLVASVCLRSSPGVLAEGMANLPLIAAAWTLGVGENLKMKWPLVSVFLASACLIKPTAVLPGTGLVLASLWQTWRSDQRSISTESARAVFSFFFMILFLVALYFFNVWNVQQNFWRSAVLYNTSSSVFGARPLKAYADFIFSGFAFFQYLTAGLVLACVGLAGVRPGMHDKSGVVPLAVGSGIGASLSLLVRPAEGQTVYWLYLLPALVILAVVGYETLTSKTTRQIQISIAAVSLAPLLYAWSIVIYGQPRNITFGGSGGLEVKQTQVEEIQPAVRALEAHSDFHPGQSRVLLWGRQWQLYYFAKAIPASSILTNETWIFDIDRPWQQQRLREAMEKSADFVVTGSTALPNWMTEVLAAEFVISFNGEKQKLYVRKTTQ